MAQADTTTTREAERGGGPLACVRVLDLSRLVAGNQLSLVLADFGADVVKLEQPGRGDPLRDWRVDDVDAWWRVYSRNKRSVTLDLKAAEGRDLLLRLVRDAHILVENFRPGTLESLDLEPDVLHEHNPRLVIARISGWGQTGTYASRPGFGTLVEAMSGFAAMNGFDDRAPVLPPLSLADMVAGLYGAVATTMALRHAEATGTGQVIDVALFESLFSILGPLAAEFELTGQVPDRRGSRSHTAAPRGVYPTKDGKWLAISASMQVMAERLLRALDLEELVTDPRFRTNSDRLRNVEELDTLVGDRIAARTLDENLELFVAHGITAGPVYTIADLLQDPHVRSRHMVVREPDDDHGLPMHNVLPRLSRTPGSIRRPAPRLGEHVEEILDGLGLDGTAIRELREKGVV